MNRGARDAGEGGSDLGFVNGAVAHDEQILAGTFGNKALGVEKNGLVVAVVERLGVGENGVGVGAGDLGTRHGDIDVLSCIRRYLAAYARLEGFFAKVFAPWPGGGG